MNTHPRTKRQNHPRRRVARAAEIAALHLAKFTVAEISRKLGITEKAVDYQLDRPRPVKLSAVRS